MGKYRVQTGGSFEASCTACVAGKYGVATGQIRKSMANQANKKAEQRVKDFRLRTPSFYLSMNPCFDDIAATLVLLMGV